MRITVDGQRHPAPTSQKARLVLARLAEPGGNLTREALAQTFWDTMPASARVSLSTELNNLRRCLGSSSRLITRTRSNVGLPYSEDLRIDLREFTEHFHREQYHEAVTLWRGDFLQDTAGGDWADDGRLRYRRMAARAFGHLADEAERAGDLIAATDFARRQRDLLPGETEAWTRLIRLLGTSGDLLAADTEREALAARYTSRGLVVPAAVLDLVEPTHSPPTAPQPQPHKRATDVGTHSDPASDLSTNAAPQPQQHAGHDAQTLERLIGQEPPSPLYTGLLELDRLLGRLPEPGLTILAGRPGMGVTTLALAIAANVSIDLAIPIAVFSIESSEAELAQRFVAMRTRIPGAELRRGKVAEQRWPKILKASQVLASATLYVDDTPQLEVREILAKVDRLKDQSAIRLVIIDSIHGLAADGGLARDSPSIASLLFELRQAARELDLSIVVTMEVFGDVEKRPDKKPQLQDLPGYFEVAAARDLVLLLYRDEYYDVESEQIGELDIIVAENRHGPVGKVSVGFDARIPRVFNLPSETDTGSPN